MYCYNYYISFTGPPIITVIVVASAIVLLIVIIVVIVITVIGCVLWNRRQRGMNYMSYNIS